MTPEQIVSEVVKACEHVNRRTYFPIRHYPKDPRPRLFAGRAVEVLRETTGKPEQLALERIIDE